MGCPAEEVDENANCCQVKATKVGSFTMTGWRNPKDPLDIPKAVRLRERARSLKAKADTILREADALLAEAEALEATESAKKSRSSTSR